MVRLPTLVRRSLPELSQAWMVYGLRPPSLRAASSTDIRFSIDAKPSKCCLEFPLADERVQVYSNLDMKLHTHTLHNVRGGGWIKGLFSALRERGDKPEAKRVEKVLDLLVAADTYAREQLNSWHRSENKDWGKNGIPEFVRESLRASRRSWELLNTALRRYRWGAQVEGGTGSFLIMRYAATNPNYGLARWEAESVGMLLEIASRPGELSRLRRCSECQHWFYATRAHQQFCGEACRRRHTAQDPQFKEKRATYMREVYRPEQRTKDERGKRQARQVLAEKSKKGGK
jgi:hypothetical protein